METEIERKKENIYRR